MTEVVNTGAVFKLLDEFSSPLRKLVAGLDAAGKKSTELQAKLDKLGLGGVVAKMRGEWSEMDRDSSAGVDKILKTMGRLGPETGAIFGEMTKGARTALEEIGTSATGLSTEVAGTFGVLRSKAVAELVGIGLSTPEAFASIDLAATGLSSDVLTRFAGLKTGAIAELQGIGTAAPDALGGVLTATVAMQSDVLAEMRAAATGSIEALRGIGAEAPGLFTPIVSEAATAANGAIAELARVNEAVRASVAGMAGLTAEANAVAMGASTIGTAVASLPSAAKGGVIQDAEAAAGSGGGVGRARHGGPHFGRVGTEIPGGHASFGGGPAMAAAGIVGYGVYEAAEMRDETNRLMITGQVDAEKWGATREQLGKLLMDSASLTGFSVKQVGEALSKSERAMSGLDVQTKMSVTKELIPYAAAEARLKETSLAESLQAMVGLAHMTGVYEPDKIRDLARKFSYVSLSTNSSLPQFEKTLSYSMPILRTGMGMDPDTIMALTAVSQNAGITSTKSGTWLRSFFQGSEPEVGDGEHAKKHNAALRKMGLLNGHNMPTWKVTGADGRTDWNVSVAKEGGIIQQHLAHVPIDQRMSVVGKIWGERGGAQATMLSMNTFVDQFVTLAGKIQKFKGGADALEEYAKDNPLQKGREAWRDFQNVLIDIGNTTLPTVNSALTNLDIVLKALPADWEATKKMWGAAADNVKSALTGDRPPMTAAGRALPDLANQGMSDFLLGRVPGVTSGSIWGSIWNQINPVGTAHAEGAIGPLPGIDTGAVTGQVAASLHKALGIPQGIDMSGAVQKAMDGFVPLPIPSAHAASGIHPTSGILEDRLTRSRASDVDPYLKSLQDKEQQSIWQFGQLTDTTGIVKASFDGLNTKATGITGALASFSAALDAATAKVYGLFGGGAGVGDVTGGSGFTNAAYTTWDSPGGGSGRALPNMRYGVTGHSHGGSSSGGTTGTTPFMGDAGKPFAGSHAEFLASIMPGAIEASKRTGIDPRIIAAQAAHESAWGKHAPGNNFFGIKGPGQMLGTHEEIGGHNVSVMASFRKYPSMAEGVAGYADFINHNRRYEPFKNAGGLENQLRELGRSGYATDSHYAEKIGAIAGRIQIPRNIAAGRPAATVSAPPPRKVSPGVSAGGAMTTAMNMPPVHVHLTHMLDGKVIAKNTTKHQAMAMRFPTDMGGPDPHSHYVSPGTPLNDVA